MCNRYEFQDWTAFAAADVPFWRRRRMERHLPRCADCRAACDSIQSVWSAVQPFAVQEINSAMYSQIQSTIALETAPRASRSRIFVRSRSPRLPRAAVFGTLGLAAALGLCAAPFLMTRPLPAFADVERAMLAVKTARYHSVQSMSFGKGRAVWVIESDNVMRFAPAAFASRGITHNLIDAANPKVNSTAMSEDRFRDADYFGDHEMYAIDRNHAAPGTAEESKQEAKLRGQLMDIISPPPLRQKGVLAPAGPGDKFTEWNVSRATIGEQTLIKFEQEREYAKLLDHRDRIQDIVWVDPQTNLVVRAEMHSFDLDAKREEATTIYDQFRYNENIPDTAFQAPMPPQAHLLVVSRERYQRNPDKRRNPLVVADADRAAIQNLIAASDTAWSQGDFAQFAAVWDFDYLSATYANPAEAAQFPIQRSKYYENLVLAQRGVWKSWHTGIKAIYPVCIGSGVPDAFCVEVFSNLRWKDRPAMRENDYTYYVHNTPNGWRILDWNPYPDSLNYPGDKKPRDSKK